MGTKRKHSGVINIGTASMIVILIGLNFAVLAALAVASAQNDYRLSEELAKHTTAYYNASNQAVKRVADSEALFESRNEEGLAAFSVPVNDRQNLEVDLVFGESKDDYEITRWQIVNSADWESDESLPVLLPGK